MSTQKFRKNNLIGLMLLALLLALTSPVSTFAQEPTPAPTAIAMDDYSIAFTTGQANVRVNSNGGRVLETLTSGAQVTVTGLERGNSITLNNTTSNLWLRVTTPSDTEGYLWSGLALVEVTDDRIPNATFYVNAEVADEDVSYIASGTQLARNYLTQEFDTPDFPVSLSVYHSTSSNLAQDQGSGAVTFTNGQAAPRLYVLNPNWLNTTALGRMGTASHENVHTWQYAQGCLTQNSLPMGNWLTEGMAEYLSQQSLVNAGLLTDEQALMQETIMFGAPVINAPTLALWESPSRMSDFQANNGYTWASLAVRHLVSEYGVDVITDLCSTAAGRINIGWTGFSTTFATVTGETLSDFYTGFNGYIAELGFVERAGSAQSDIGDVGANGCGTGSAVLSRIRISCQGVNPDARQAGFIIQPANHFGDITEVILPTGATGRWEERTEIYFVRFSSFEYDRVYTVTFVINGNQYPFTFAFRQ